MKYVAHIITAEAVALGDPEVAVMTEAYNGGAAVLVARYDIFDSPEETLADHDYVVNTNSRTDVETGYYIYDDVTRQDAAVPTHCPCCARGLNLYPAEHDHFLGGQCKKCSHPVSEHNTVTSRKFDPREDVK